MPSLAQRLTHVPSKDLLSWTFDDVAYDQDRPIYLDALKPDRSVSARQARTIIRKLVAGFRKLGVKEGDTVCLHSRNDLYFGICFLAVAAVGARFACTNVAYTPYELAHHCRTAKVRFVICAPEFLAPMLEAAKQVDIPNSRILLFDSDNQKVQPGFTKWSDLFHHGEEDWVRFDDKETADNTIAALLFSSGTTGLPKAVMLSHRNLIAQHTLVFENQARPVESRLLHALPMFHAAAFPVACITPLRAGYPSYIMRGFDLETFFQCFERYKITELSIVPPVAIALIMSPLRLKYSIKSAVLGRCGAAPLDARVQARVQALMAPGAPFTQVWGMTETSCVCSMFMYPEADSTGSVGRFLPNVDVKLVDETGTDITGYDVRGELCVRGTNVVKGYFENPEANARDWDDEGFFHTGDVAYCDAQTKLWYIVDRKKELIKVRGFQVAPAELEGVLLDHPDIVDCAIIGVQFNQEESEFPRAYVVRRQGVGDTLSAEAVKTHLAERLTYYKRLDGGVVFIDAIPKTASGKILKRVLRDQAAKEIGAKL